MKKVIKYLSLFLIWGILLSIEIIFAVVLYKEAIRFPVELVGPSRKEDAVFAILIITVVVFLACIIWFFAWKTMWKNQDIFDRITSGNELNAKEMRDFMEPYRFLKTKYIHQSKGL